MKTLPVPLLTLDPSSTHIGWATLNWGPSGPAYVASGVYKIPEAPPDHRVLMVGAGVEWIVNQCRNAPGTFGVVAQALVEVPDYIADHVRAQSIIPYFRAVGVAEYTVHRMGIPIQRERASKYKRSSRKREAKDRFFQITGRYPLTDDESDALCIGWDYLTALNAPQTPPAASPAPHRTDDEWDDYGVNQ